MSETSIMNQALDLLEEEPILSPDDDRAAVRWMQRNYQPVMDSLLRMHPWNFASARTALAAVSEPPSSGWSYQYDLPADCLRVLPLNGGTLNGASVPYIIEGRRILSNAGAPLSISYIRRVTDTNQMDALFVQVFAATLASRAANWLTGKQGYSQALKQQAGELMLQAQIVDALEGSPAEPEADDWVNGRTTGTAYGSFY
jgi:hypothetical protein